MYPNQPPQQYPYNMVPPQQQQQPNYMQPQTYGMPNYSVTVSQSGTYQQPPTNGYYNPMMSSVYTQPSVNVNLSYQQPNTYLVSSTGPVYPNVDYRIRSVRNGNVLDDWGGKTGEASAAYQKDDAPSSVNRAFRLIPVDGRPGWYRIKSSKGTVLDDWGGKVGENSAAFQHDDAPTSENRMFQIIPVSGHFVIKGSKGTVLDDWGGKTGENSAAFNYDDRQDYVNTNRLWDFIPHGQTYTQPSYLVSNTGIVYPNVDYRIRSVRNGNVLDDWGGKTGEASAAYQRDDAPSSVNRAFRLIPVDGRPGWYRIKSSKGTVLDDWGGKTGENSAAFQHDDAPTSENRMFQIIPASGHFVIKSSKGTVLDDWGGKVGENSAAFSNDDRQDYLNTNRLWDFIPHGQP